VAVKVIHHLWIEGRWPRLLNPFLHPVPPRCADALRRARDTAICREYDRLIQTMSGNEAVQRLARTHRLSDRRVFDILKRTPMTTINVGGAVQLKLLG